MTLVQYPRPIEVEHERERARGWLEVMAPAIELAKAIASTDFVPRAMRNNPAEISAAILYGDELAIGPMQSLARISVIEGRPTLAAETQRALVYAAGHELWLDELTATRATWCGRRAGTDQITRVTWTMDDARRAGLAGKTNWRNYPRQMLSARASAELVRAVFADVIGGMAATEEIDDELEPATAARAPSDRATTAGRGSSASKRRRRSPAAVARPAATPETPAGLLPPLPGEPAAAPETSPPAAGPVVDVPGEDVPRITGPQRRRMMGLFRRHRPDDSRADRLRYASELVGRTLSSSNDLTTAEADRVIDDLEATREPEQAPDANAGELADRDPGPGELADANAEQTELEV